MKETQTTRFCLKCGYSLQGHADNSQCPECGTPFSQEDFTNAIQKPTGGSWKLLAPPVATFLALLLLHGLTDFACIAHPLILLAGLAWGISIARNHARWKRLASIAKETTQSTGKGPSHREHRWLFGILEGILVLTAWLAAFELLLYLEQHYGLGPFILTT